MSKGAGVLVLESLEHAVKRNAPILCEVIGNVASSVAYHLVANHLEGSGAFIAMRNALNKAIISIQEVDVISAHATSTPLEELSETIAINNLFWERTYHILVTGNKSMLGHMLGAAGGERLLP